MNKKERDELVKVVREETARIFEARLGEFLKEAEYEHDEFVRQAEDKLSFTATSLKSMAVDVKAIRELQRADLTQSYENSLGVPAMLALKRLRNNEVDEAIRELDGLRMKLVNRTIADLARGR